MVADMITDAFEHDALEIVIEDGSRDASPGAEGPDMSAEKALEGLIKSEVCIQGPGPGEHEHEAGKDAFGQPDTDLAEVGPVRLALLPW